MIFKQLGLILSRLFADRNDKNNWFLISGINHGDCNNLSIY